MSRFGIPRWILLVLTAVGATFICFHDPVFVRAQHIYYETRNLISGKDVSHIETFGNAKVYLPSNYFEDEGTTFPTLYLLHGFPGNNADWIINGNVGRTLDEMIGSGEIPPLIVVFPDGNGQRIKDSEYLNATKIDQKIEDSILELVAEVDKNYRTKVDRRYRGIGGVSTGAYGAVNIGLHHNNIFATLLSHSGYFLNKEAVTNKLLNDEDYAQNNPLDYLADHSLDPQTFIYFDVASWDNGEFKKQNEKMDKLLDGKGITHEFQQTQGWHDWGVWRQNVRNSLKFMATHLPSRPPT